MSVVYEVNLAVRRDVAEDFAAWLERHIDQMLELDGFEEATWYERRPEDEGRADDRRLWTVCYRLPDRAALQRYFDEHASRMRADATERFGGRFDASRRILDQRAVTRRAR